MARSQGGIVHPPVELFDAVVVRPGDTLIVRVSAGVSKEQFDEVADEIKARLP